MHAKIKGKNERVQIKWGEKTLCNPKKSFCNPQKYFASQCMPN
jgi:hypothetical protein